MIVNMNKTPLSFRFMASCTIGTFLEFFDYTLYGYFSVVIGHLFFPNENPSVQLLATWGIFSIGFLIRPFGAMVLGHIADKKGRSKVLPFTILFMALPTMCIGFLPTFQSVGWWAPLLLLFCRLVQGVAISAEYNAASIFILENNWKRPGFLASLTPFACGMGMLSASLLAYLCVHSTHETISVWQWRAPFIIAGAVVGVVGWYLRRIIQETESFKQLETNKKILRRPAFEVFKKHKAPMVINIISSAFMASTSYLIFVYMASFLHHQFNFSSAAALTFTSIAVVLESTLALFFGWLSDKIKRWKLMFFSSIAIAIAAPLLLIKPELTSYQLLTSLTILVILLSAFDGPLTIFLPMLFETNVRYSATAIGYNIGGAALGGLAPFFVSLLLQTSFPPQYVLGTYLAVFALAANFAIIYHARRSEVTVATTEIAVKA